MRRFAAVVAVLGTLTGAARLPASDPFTGLDEAVAKGMKAHKVPGLGVAVVKAGKVILCKGYGVRTTGQSDPVTGDTLFAIGSVSKSFTATCLAMLVDEKKIGWDSPLIAHVSNFRLKDPYRTQEITVRDALAHRTGIERNEFLWYGSPFDRAEVIGKLRFVDTDNKFRTTFRYNNILYLAAGQVVPGVMSGKSWDDFVSERVFEPLKMKRANTSVKVLKNFKDVATPHEKPKGVVKSVAWRDIDNIGPAGAINASAADMAEYVKFHLAEGKGPDKRLVKREVFKELHEPQMLMGNPGFSFNPDSHSRAYGLGWMLSDHKGRRVVEHGGNIDGMSAQVGMLPGEQVGVVILANMGGSLLPQALMFDLFDRLLGEPDLARAEKTGLLSWVNEYAIMSAGEPNEASRVKVTKPSLPLEKYAGRYEHAAHAPVRVKSADGKLSLEFNGLMFDLEHWHYDTFRGKDRREVFPGILFTFALDSDGRVSQVRSTAFGRVTFDRK